MKIVKFYLSIIRGMFKFMERYVERNVKAYIFMTSNYMKWALNYLWLSAVDALSSDDVKKICNYIIKLPWLRQDYIQACEYTCMIFSNDDAKVQPSILIYSIVETHYKMAIGEPIPANIDMWWYIRECLWI